MITPSRTGYIVLGWACVLTLPLLVVVGGAISTVLAAMMVAGAGWCLIRSQDGKP